MSAKNTAKTQRRRSGRFVEGESGNPKGRPKKPRPAASAFEIIVDQRARVTRDGVEHELSAEDALKQKTLRDAFAGDRGAIRYVGKCLFQREEARAARIRPSYNIPVNFSGDPDNADAALLLLGIASPDPKPYEVRRAHLRLEPWAVQMALSRRRGGARLSPKEITDVKRCTRAPETLRWPRNYGESGPGDGGE